MNLFCDLGPARLLCCFIFPPLTNGPERIHNGARIDKNWSNESLPMDIYGVMFALIETPYHVSKTITLISTAKVCPTLPIPYLVEGASITSTPYQDMIPGA